jgi:predicted DNA-binding transcriptional regulator AlpA
MNAAPRPVSTQTAMAILGVTARSTFWDVLGEDNLKIVHPIRLTSRCIRFYEHEIVALRDARTVRTSGDLRRLADGRRS